MTRPRRRARRDDVLAAIARMRVLQIDTIHVVARSPYLVLFSRLGAYPSRWLEELLAEGALFECWAHEACFAPSADFALHRAHAGQDARKRHWAMRIAERTRQDHADGMRQLLARIREHGPVKSSDFERKDGSRGGWWGWKNEKRWLEALFALGDLMIARRDNFQRVYDLSERVLENARSHGHCAHAAPLTHDTETDWSHGFVSAAVRALGITQARWINDYFRSGRRLKDGDLDVFVDSGELRRVDVAGWGAPAYVHAAHDEWLSQAGAGRLRATHACLLSPFDPVVWDRDRAAAMFGFDYRLECYTPAPTRQYGYFVLPILRAGRLVGRVDAKAHRADGVFEVKALYLEDGVAADEAMAASVARAIAECAHWHGMQRTTVTRCEPVAFRRPLLRALADS